MAIAERLEDIQNKENNGPEELNLPFYTRAIKPIVDKLEKAIGRITPVGMKKSIEHKLHMAGDPFKNGISSWVALRTSCFFGIPGLTFLFLFAFQVSAEYWFLIGIISLLLAMLIPQTFLRQKIEARQREIQKTLPDVLDLVTVSVEAGLSFDAALGKVGEKMPGQLAKLFNRALQEIKMGRSRRDAFKEMAEETGVADLIAFISAIIQADQLGVSIANVLRIQSQQMRDKRRQRVQENAMKAPVKILIPLVVFIFPTIFIILLGPAILMIMEVFSL